MGNNRILVILFTAQSQYASISCYGACLKWLLPELLFSDRWSRGTKLWERDCIFVPHLGEIFHQFGHKLAFSVKLRPIYGHARPLLLHILEIAQQFGTFAGLEIEIN